MKNEIFSPVYGISFFKFYIGFKGKTVEGHPSRVNFDAVKMMKRRRYLLGFYHTHPGSSTLFSTTDSKTMEAWCSALGKNLICLIAADGRPTAGWWFNYKEGKFDIGPVRDGKRFVWGRY